LAIAHALMSLLLELLAGFDPADPAFSVRRSCVREPATVRGVSRPAALAAERSISYSAPSMEKETVSSALPPS
jgi:hypothetical protein